MARCLFAVYLLAVLLPLRASAEFRAGAAVVDVSPTSFPVLVNGGMTSRTADSVTTRLHARAIVVDDGKTRIGIVVVDSCMMPRPFLDDAKARAALRTNIRADRMLISATHTHSAPSVMEALGTDADENYIPLLRVKIGDALVEAEKNLEPAEVGWGVGKADEFTALRRWIRRPDRMDLDPFGNRTVRATMHAGKDWDNVTGESGPEDPDLSIIAFRSLNGRPIGVLANFSMHYFSGEKPLSADYFGLFCNGLQTALQTEPAGNSPPFVVAMSHGCSGDIWRRDYTMSPAKQDRFKKIDEYANGLLKIAKHTYDDIQFYRPGSVAMEEQRLQLNYRVPDLQRLEWAQRIIAAKGDAPITTREHVYAREQIKLHELQSTEVVVQALRIGNIAIATTPCETYALTGLKLKRRSPLPQTMVIELANGGDGYIPPPEQHPLGGYNTWAARSAGLEIQAESKIVAADLKLLEKVTQQLRRPADLPIGPGSAAIRQLKPKVWYRLNEMDGVRAIDEMSGQRHALYEGDHAFYLAGPHSKAFCGSGNTNRAVHLAGGHVSTRLSVDANYSVSMWFWNGLPYDARKIAGWLFSRDDSVATADGVRFGLGGIQHPGLLILQRGDSNDIIAGRTTIKRWTWNHAVFVNSSDGLRVYLNGTMEPEIRTKPQPLNRMMQEFLFGGSSLNSDSFEGRIDEVAVFDRALTVDEVQKLFRSAAGD